MGARHSWRATRPRCVARRGGGLLPNLHRRLPGGIALRLVRHAALERALGWRRDRGRGRGRHRLRRRGRRARVRHLRRGRRRRYRNGWLGAAGRLLQLGRALEDQDGEPGHHHDRGGLQRYLHRPRQEHPARQAPVPRLRAGRHHPVDEADRRPGGRHRAQEADGVREAIPLARALGTGRQMRVDGRTLLGRQRVVHAGREQVTDLLARHGSHRSSLALRSSRARCRRERTVFSGSPRTSAISS